MRKRCAAACLALAALALTACGGSGDSGAAPTLPSFFRGDEPAQESAPTADAAPASEAVSATAGGAQSESSGAASAAPASGSDASTTASAAASNDTATTDSPAAAAASTDGAVAVPAPVASQAERPTVGVRYTVRYEDTLAQIARRFGTTVAAILAVNDLANPNVIVAGTELLIPVIATSESTQAGADGSGTTASSGDNVAVASTPATPTPPAVPSSSESGQPAGGPVLATGADGASGLAEQIDVHNDAVRQALLSRLRTISPAEFSRVVIEVLAAMGFESVTSAALGEDGGVDLRGTLVVGGVVRTRMVVHAQQWADPVSQPTVQQARGALGAHEQALVITSGEFAAAARAEAERTDASPVALMSGEQMVELMIQFEVGVRRDAYTLLTLD